MKFGLVYYKSGACKDQSFIHSGKRVTDLLQYGYDVVNDPKAFDFSKSDFVNETDINLVIPMVFM